MESKNKQDFEHWMNPLFTDFYQVTMCYSYWKGGRQDEHAVFEAFFRKCPFKGNFAIFAGLDEVISFLKAFKFTQEHIDYLRIMIPHAEEEFFEWLLQMNTEKLIVKGIPDGTIVFASQPLLSLEGPVALVQLIETPVLNLINFATLICTNAARMKIRSGSKVKCIEFGLRRAQGPNGALTATKYSFVGGFDGSSNVYAGLLYDIPINGTIAHSFIMSFGSSSDLSEHHFIKGVDVLNRALEFREELGWQHTNDSELYSFVSFACSYPDNFLCLADTYNTIESGCKNFILVGLVLSELGYKPKGVRLDSGDLAQLSKDCKRLWIETGNKYGYDYSDLIVIASNDINEETIVNLNKNNHEIDIFGIGTNLVTCQAQPALGMVYKLVQIEGKPRIKLSEEMEKVLIPGEKKVFRIYENDEPSFDIMLLEDEEDLKDGDSVTGYFNEYEKEHTITVESATKIAKITEKLFENGNQVLPDRNMADKRSFVLKQIEEFNGDIVKTDKKKYSVLLSKKLKDTFNTLFKSAKMY